VAPFACFQLEPFIERHQLNLAALACFGFSLFRFLRSLGESFLRSFKSVRRSIRDYEGEVRSGFAFLIRVWISRVWFSASDCVVAGLKGAGLNP